MIAHLASFDYSHDLMYLTQLCIKLEPDLKKLMSTVEILDRYGTELRYPMEDSEEPDLAQANDMIRLAKKVATLVRNR